MWAKCTEELGLIPESDDEVKRTIKLHSMHVKPIEDITQSLFSNFSNYKKLKLEVAWMLRCKELMMKKVSKRDRQ